MRGDLYVKSFNALGLSGRVNGVGILDSYLIEHNLQKGQFFKIGEALANPALEKFFVNDFPDPQTVRKLYHLHF